jgi:predicted ATP-grasp superfamily ATP-dependent carboligase
MKILVTTARMPFAIGLIRRLGEAGHEVLASDTYRTAPGDHSRYVSRHFVTPAPKLDPPGFVDEVARISEEQGVDAIVPPWEDVFYLSALRSRLPPDVELYGARFDALARLHDKSTFQNLAEELDVRAPETVTARSREELRAATERFPRYFARAAFSRGGVELLTNTGPLAGQVSIDDVEPSQESPWLVQEFVDGPMICTYSTLHDGRATAHCAYRAPRQWEHSTGIQFESIDGSESLEVVEKIGGSLGYTGQISFDFVASPGGIVIIECNPRTTDGILLMDPEQAAGGIADPQRQLSAVEAGRLVELDFAVFAQIFREPLREAPRSIHDLLHVRDADAGWHDHLPLLYSFLAFAHHERLNIHERKKLMVAMSEDVCWDGEAIPGSAPVDLESPRTRVEEGRHD